VWHDGDVLQLQRALDQAQGTEDARDYSARLADAKARARVRVHGFHRWYGKLVPAIRKALEEADGSAIAGATARGEAFEIVVEGQTIPLTEEDVLVETSSAEGYACGEDAGYLTALDTSLNPELIREGLAREMIRTVQEARKQAGLDVADRIALGVSGSPAVMDALAEYRAYLMAETLAEDWSIGQVDPLWKEERKLDDDHWTIEISRLP